MRYTKAQRRQDMFSRLMSLGLTYQEADKLRLIELTLQRWSERECGTDNGCIERDETTNKPYWLNSTTMRRWPIPDRETGALKRLAGIMANHPTLTYYHQTDPRGCALYILKRSDVQDAAIDSVYTRGVAVCD